MKRNNDYVNNIVLLESIRDLRQRRVANPETPLTETIGRDIIAISNGLIKRWNFNGYTDDWKEQMIGDGIEAAIKAVKNFDTDRFFNPHAYLTTVCFRAFQNRIKIERKKSVGKYKYFVEEVFDFASDEMSANVDVDFYQDMVNKIAAYETSEKASKQKAKLSRTDDPKLRGLGILYGNDF